MPVWLSWLVIILLGIVSYVSAWALIVGMNARDLIEEEIKKKSPLWVMYKGRWVNFKELTVQEKLEMNRVYSNAYSKKAETE